MPKKKKEPRKEFYFIADRKERGAAYAQYLSKKPPSFNEQQEVIEVSAKAQEINEKKTLANKLAYGYVKEIRLKRSTSFKDVINFIDSLKYERVEYFQEASILNFIVNSSDRSFTLKAYNTVNGYFIIKYKEMAVKKANRQKLAKKYSKKEKKPIEHKEYDSSSKHNKIVALNSPHSVPAPKNKKPNYANNKSYKRKRTNK